LVVYGLYDFQLTTPERFTTSALIGNHAMLYYIEPFYARRFYSLSLHDSSSFAPCMRFPYSQNVALFGLKLKSSAVPWRNKACLLNARIVWAAPGIFPSWNRITRRTSASSARLRLIFLSPRPSASFYVRRTTSV
jgi:hypothetical protein